MPAPAIQFPHISLEQWRALIAVVDEGGFAQAAAALHKSQSSITYAVQKIARQLDLAIFTMQGRRAVLTEAGEVLVRRARELTAEALALERGAAAMAEGWQAEVALAAEILFPTWLLLECIAEFAAGRPAVRIELHETVLGGTDEALAEGRVDFAICSQVPPGRIGELLMEVRGIAVAHPGHPLHRLNRTLTLRDLKRHRHIFIRDSGRERSRRVAWEGAAQRLTVSNKATAIRALTLGLGFAWFVEDAIREELDAGLLKPLPLGAGSVRRGQLYLVHADPEFPGRDAVALADLIKARTAAECARRGGRPYQ